jgi:hypothetical protein
LATIGWPHDGVRVSLKHSLVSLGVNYMLHQATLPTQAFIKSIKHPKQYSIVRLILYFVIESVEQPEHP